MQLPRPSAGYLQFASFGRYVARRLKQAEYTQLAKDTLASAVKVRASGRAWEDSDDALQDALADRDGADDALDLAAQTLRTALAGRSAHAEWEEPYTLIFPNGVGEYTAAPIDEEVNRYGTLLSLAEKHLAPTDSARKEAASSIKSGVRDYKAALEAVDHASQGVSVARSELDRAIGSFARQMEKVYGLLIADVGRREAERFFPAGRSGHARANRAADPEPLPPAPAK